MLSKTGLLTELYRVCCHAVGNCDWHSQECNRRIPKSMSPEEREAQRRSFAYGNSKIDNDAMTREAVDAAAESMSPATPAAARADGMRDEPYGTAVHELVSAASAADDAMATWFSGEYNSHPIHLRLRKALDAGYTLARCIRKLEQRVPAAAAVAGGSSRTAWHDCPSVRALIHSGKLAAQNLNASGSAIPRYKIASGFAGISGQHANREAQAWRDAAAAASSLDPLLSRPLGGKDFGPNVIRYGEKIMVLDRREHTHPSRLRWHGP
jgi:hypothetical protein